MATIRDIAKRAGVSVSTVSYALNNDPRIREETRRKVLQAAEELNYRPSGMARTLKKQRTQTIGVFLHDMSGPFYSEIIAGIQDVVSSNGYDLIVCLASPNARDPSRFLRERFLDGAILHESGLSDSLILQLAEDNFPIVVLDRELESANVHSVLTDNVRGAYEAVEHLICLGYRKIAYLSGPADSYDNMKRFEGFQQALVAHQIPYKQSWNVQGSFTEVGGYLAGKMLIAGDERPEAVFAANDEMAIGALRAFEEAGLRVPDDIAIVGFDDIRLASYVRPALTTVRQPKYEWGAMAAHTVFQLLQGGDVPSIARLATELVVRESCGSRLRQAMPRSSW